MTRRKNTSRKRKTSRRKKPAARARRTPARKKPSRRTASRKQSPARRSARQAPALSTGLSLDRKLDILGVALSAVGLFTFLSLLSISRSSITGAWVAFLRQSIGWGLFLLPLGLVTVGLWLILRHFERVPQVSLERIAGGALLFVGMLFALHFALSPENREASMALAEAGRGGGYIGAGLQVGLTGALGRLGTGIALTAWLLIAAAMTFDVSVAELFRWVSPVASRFWQLTRDLGSRLPRPAVDRSPAPPADVLPAPPHANPVPRELGPAPDVQTIPLPAADDREWSLPPLAQILDLGDTVQFDEEYDRQRARLIEETLASFGAPSTVVEINRGPTITQYGVEPQFVESRGSRTRVRVSKIASLADDLALALAASRIRVQAPVPGKGFVGIEVPNEEVALVGLRDVIESPAFQRLDSPLSFALGQNVAGQAVAADLAAMPHLLIAGATGSGKSVSVNALISCLLLNNTPQQLRLLMVDPKRVELTGYNGIPHLLAPVVVELDRVVGALQWVTREMDQRYHKLARVGARNIQEYNAYLVERGETGLPYLVVIIDELADLMMLAPDSTEKSVTRLAQLARATGIHLVISTQRPSVDVVTGLIKANFPARVAFAVASGVDSRVILDQPGAERLLGSGDMLFQAPDAPAPVRLQGVFVSENEIFRLVQYWRALAGTAPVAEPAKPGAVDDLPRGIPLKQLSMLEEMEAEDDRDPLLEEAIDYIRRQGRVSVSMLQRRLRIGYTRASRLVETMEERGIVSPPLTGTSTREILDYGPAAPPVGEE